ncbi:MAG: hypothetical protein V2A58_07535 [Planctomycetota bacterium]
MPWLCKARLALGLALLAVVGCGPGRTEGAGQGEPAPTVSWSEVVDAVANTLMTSFDAQTSTFEGARGERVPPTPDMVLFLLDRFVSTRDENFARIARAAAADVLKNRQTLAQDAHGKARLLLLAFALARVLPNPQYNEVAHELAQTLMNDLEDPPAKAPSAWALFEAAGSLGDARYASAAKQALLDAPDVESADLANALISAYEYTGDLGFRSRAGEVFAAVASTAAADPDGLAKAGQMAQAAMRLYYLTDESRFKEAAGQWLAPFAENYRTFAAHAGAYALGASWRENYPLKCVLIGREDDPRRRDLHDALLKLPVVRRVVIPVDPAKEPQELRRLGYPDTGKPTAFLCTDKTCAPVKDVEALQRVFPKLW